METPVKLDIPLTYRPFFRDFAASTSLGRNSPLARRHQVYRKKRKQAQEQRLKRRRVDFDNMGSNQFTRSRKYKRYQKYTLKKHLYPAVAPVEDRFQGLTNFDTNSGYTRLSQFAVGGRVYPPVVIMDLTSFQAGGDIPPVMKRIGWENLTTTAAVTSYNIYGQSANGEPSTGTASWTVTDTNTTAIALIPRVFLKWVDLRFNLYGARNRTTTFNLYLVKFPETTQNLFTSPGAREAAELLQYLERPLIYNNLQIGDQSVIKKMNIVKKYSWTVQPMTNDSLNTTTGNIKEAKVFINMNKALNLSWPDEGTHEGHALPNGLNNDGIDYEIRNAQHRTGPVYGSRVYAILTAFSPVLKNFTQAGEPNLTPSEAYARFGTGGNDVDAGIEPSFDFLIRRGYLVEPN